MSMADFGDDEGTLHRSGCPPTQISSLWDTARWEQPLRRSLEGRPIIWFADDEHRNRKWFAEKHADHFAVLTLSSLDFCRRALDHRTPCDAVVTDIFFPAAPVRCDGDAERLMAIYDLISKSPVSRLPSLWDEQKHNWSLDGFHIARIVADAAKDRAERIPVLLFSRKATMLLGVDDWLGEPSDVVANTYWLLEKVDPSIDPESADKAGRIQRDRIVAALSQR